MQFRNQVPFSISRFIAAGVGISIPTKQLLKNLIAMLLVPIILGKVMNLASWTESQHIFSLVFLQIKMSVTTNFQIWVEKKEFICTVLGSS